MWTTFHLGHYVPLSWMTLGLDYVVWGMNPLGYHLTSVIFHAANAALVFILAKRLFRTAAPEPTIRGSIAAAAMFAALLFAVHPLRVESVVWVTERRDVLSLFFCLLSVLAYFRSCDGPRRAGWYWTAVALFVAGLLSKATVMTLPAVLFLLNFYPLKRLGWTNGWWTASARRIYLELVPFGAAAAASMALSIIALKPLEQLSPAGKLAASAYSLSFYIWKSIAPVSLSPLYEMPQRVDPANAVFVLCYAVAVVLSVGAWLARRRWPGPATGWFIFVIISLPMLGIVQNGPQIAADRYTYHAAPALALLGGGGLFLVAAIPAVLQRGLASVVVVVLAALTWNQSGVWRDSETLWSHALAIDPRSGVAHSAFASVLFQQDRLDEAVVHSRRAVELAPNYAQARNDLGVAFARQGRFAEAVEEYKRALALDPRYDEAQNNWGVVAVQQGDLADAIAHYRQAIALNPDYADAHVNWGNALVRLGLPNEAISHYSDAVRIRPDHAAAQLNWGVALARQGKFAEAIEHFREALAVRPDYAEAKEYLDRATQALRAQPPAGRLP